MCLLHFFSAILKFRCTLLNNDNKIIIFLILLIINLCGFSPSCKSLKYLMVHSDKRFIFLLSGKPSHYMPKTTKVIILLAMQTTHDARGVILSSAD